MSVRPIIFSGPMVRALLDRRKTQTRRLAWKLPYVSPDFPGKPSLWQNVNPGDLLYVREAHHLTDTGAVIYRADYPANAEARGFENIPPESSVRWSPSIHMPRRASRLTLEVTEVRIEPLQAITEADAQAEGMSPPFVVLPDPFDGKPAEFPVFAPPVAAFASLWRTLHGRGSWDENPDVVVMAFAVHGPISRRHAA